jgi:manganese transport protein
VSPFLFYSEMVEEDPSTARSMVSKIAVAYRNSRLARFIWYMGPALMVSIAYMDPGNYGTDIQGGAGYNYNLLWVVWLASGMAMLLQYLSGKLGIATGQSLPEILHEKLKKKKFIIPYWLAAEAAAAATDLAEYLGTVIALNLLFGIPMIYAAIFGALDVIILLTFMSSRFRIIEQMFLLFVSVISIGYLYEIFITRPDPSAIAIHSLVPMLPDNHAIMIAVGVIGATVMPHALFLHSSLTANKIKNSSPAEKRRILKLHRYENIITLTIAGFVNAAIMVMASAAFYNGHSNVTSVSDAYETMIPLFGAAAGVIFVLTLLSSGISSSIVGTLAGQFVFEGLLGRKVNVWLRRFITRFVNVVPTTVAILVGLDPLSILVYSQVILSLMIPLPMIPIVMLCRNKKLMGEFVNRKTTTVLAFGIVAVILVFNTYLLISTFFPAMVPFS